MVAIAQLVEHLIVVQKVARSSRVGHPSKTLPFAEGFFFSMNSPLLGYRPNRHAGNHRVVHSGHIQFTEHKDKRSVMLSFENDYSRAAHPAVLEAVAEANNHLYSGYGSDELSDQAKAKIREACGQPDADVWFLVGGTQTNQVVIDTITPAYAGVVAVASGHPNVHEAGAIEFSGHKVLTIPQHNGKMDPTELDEFCKTFYADGNYEHMVFPGSVYVSQSTEYGTIYSKAELQAIADVAHKYDMPLFVDGARLGYALTATGSDMTLADLATIADVFYIGGTKVGALLAKGFVLGAQFDALFTDNLYFKIARNANEAADRIREALRAKGYTLTFEAPTNQIFVTMDQPTIDRLEREIKLGFTEKADDTHTVMRICTSWATTPEEVDQLIELL